MKLVFGTSGFEYLASHRAEAEILNAAMAEVTRNVARIAIASCDFSRYRVILDIGGGNGAFLAEVLRQVPSATGILFDVPAGLTEAQGTLLRADATSRCTVVAGDFFKSVPSGADLMILKSVNHDWDDEPLDMRMLTVAGGLERTEDEYRKLLVDAGFAWDRTIVLPAPWDQSMIEAIAI